MATTVKIYSSCDRAIVVEEDVVDGFLFQSFKTLEDMKSINQSGFKLKQVEVKENPAQKLKEPRPRIKVPCHDRRDTVSKNPEIPPTEATNLPKPNRGPAKHVRRVVENQKNNRGDYLTSNDNLCLNLTFKVNRFPSGKTINTLSKLLSASKPFLFEWFETKRSLEPPKPIVIKNEMTDCGDNACKTNSYSLRSSRKFVSDEYQKSPMKNLVTAIRREHNYSRKSSSLFISTKAKCNEPPRPFEIEPEPKYNKPPRPFEIEPEPKYNEPPRPFEIEPEPKCNEPSSSFKFEPEPKYNEPSTSFKFERELRCNEPPISFKSKQGSKNNDNKIKPALFMINEEPMDFED